MKKHIFNMKLCIFSCIVTLSIISTLIPAFAASFDSQTKKILFITDVAESKSMNSFNAQQYDSALADLVEINNIDMNAFSDYEAIALPFEEEAYELAKSAYEIGSTVYLYGQLTIQDYKEIGGIENYALAVPIYKNDGTTEKVEQFFDATYEENELFNVISYSDYALLCKISPEISNGSATTYMQRESYIEMPNSIYLSAIENNFLELKSKTMTKGIIDSEFDFVHYFGPNADFSVHLDYTLYKNDSERDTAYDYLGIKTNVWVDNDYGEVTRLQTKYDLTFSADNLLETGPEPQTNAGELSVSIGYGNSGPSGNISYSVDLSNIKPNISRDEDYTNDIVEWAMTPRTWFPIYLGGTSFHCCATWASKETRSAAAIDIFYAGRVNTGPSGIHPVDSTYVKVPVRFFYS